MEEIDFILKPEHIKLYVGTGLKCRPKAWDSFETPICELISVEVESTNCYVRLLSTFGMTKLRLEDVVFYFHRLEDLQTRINRRSPYVESHAKNIGIPDHEVKDILYMGAITNSFYLLEIAKRNFWVFNQDFFTHCDSVRLVNVK